MMMLEFMERSGVAAIDRGQYAEIEKAYYGFSGNKDSFCSIFRTLANEPDLLNDFLVTCFRSDDKETELPKYRVHGWHDECEIIGHTFNFSYCAEVNRKRLRYKYPDHEFYIV